MISAKKKFYTKKSAAMLFALVFIFLFLMIINLTITVPYTEQQVVKEDVMTVDVEYIYGKMPYEVIVPSQGTGQELSIITGHAAAVGYKEVRAENPVVENSTLIYTKETIKYRGILTDFLVRSFR